MKKKCKTLMFAEMYYSKILNYFDTAQYKIKKERDYYAALCAGTNNDFLMQTASYICNQLSKTYDYTLEIASLLENLAHGRKIVEDVNFMISSVIDDLLHIEDYCGGCSVVVSNDFIGTTMEDTQSGLNDCIHMMLVVRNHKGNKLIKIIESEYWTKPIKQNEGIDLNLKP